jgi:hypothetical protein
MKILKAGTLIGTHIKDMTLIIILDETSGGTPISIYEVTIIT